MAHEDISGFQTRKFDTAKTITGATIGIGVLGFFVGDCIAAGVASAYGK